MEFILGTVCGINLYEGGSDKLYARIFARIREIDRTMGVRAADFQEMMNGGALVEADSRTAAALEAAEAAMVSGVAKINRNAGIAPVKVRADLIEVLEKALYYAELSDGAFDPTVGPLVNLWGIGTGTGTIPSETEISSALALVNWQDLIISKGEGTAFLRREGMALDLGAIARGYAADEAVRLAREGGAKRGIFDLGGSVAVLGERGSGKESAPWRIGVPDPLKEPGSYIGSIPARDKSIVTSGVYQRYFESKGRRYHHIFSTKDGWPVNNGLLSVSIVAGRSVDADALATAVFALGYEKGRALVKSITDTRAVFVFEDRSIRITGDLQGIFSPLGDGYVLLSGAD